MSAKARSDMEQAILNNIKLARTMVRARYSVLADEELNELLPEIRRKLEAQAQSGQVIGLTADEVRAIIEGN